METENMTDPTCASCERRLIPHRVWKGADQVQRTVWLEAGLAQGSGRGLCHPCYTKHYKRGTLENFPRTTTPRQYVLEDWEHLRDEVAGMPQNRAVEVLAPRMGMTPAALERALSRARGTTLGRDTRTGQFVGVVAA